MNLWVTLVLLRLHHMETINPPCAEIRMADFSCACKRRIRCGMRPTSCPDQLAEALTEALEQL